MPFVLRKEGDTENPVLPVVYGHQSTRGQLVYYSKGGATGTQTKFICVLGLGEMDGVDRVLWGGNTLAEYNEAGVRVWRFHPGTLSTGFTDPVQGRPEFFPELDFTFSGIAYIEVLLPSELSSDSQDEPSQMFFFVRGRKVQDYTVSGDVLTASGSPILSSNNALVAADIMTSFMKLPLSRIHGSSWQSFKTRCDEALPWVGGNNTLEQNVGFTDITGATVIDNSGLMRSLAGTGWNVSGGRTKNFLAPGVDGYFEVVAGDGTFVAGWTSSTYVTSAAQIILGIQCNAGNVYSVVIDGVTYARTAWAPNNVFRFAREGGVFKIYHNGNAISSSGFPADPGINLRGGVAFFTYGSSVANSTFFPASTSTVTGETKTTPRYEAHVVFTSDTEATAALQAVMARAPGCHWQDVNGKIKFITHPDYFDITGGASLPAGNRALSGKMVYDPTQIVLRSNIVEKSFSVYRKSLFDKPNYLRSSFRNRDSELYDMAYSAVDRKTLRDQAKALIDPGIIPLGVCTQSLSDRILETQMRLTSDLDLFVTAKGQANTHQIAKGDVLQLSHDVPGWRETAPPLFLVVDETFESTVGDGSSADDRSFTLQIYSPDFYTDDSHGPVSGVIASSLASTSTPPPIADTLTLSESSRVLPDGTVIPIIDGSVQFTPFEYRQVGQVWIKRPGSSDYAYTNITLTPDSTNAASFSIEAVESGLHYIRVVTSSLSGISLEPITSHLTASITVSGAASLSAPNAPTSLTPAALNSMVVWTWNASTSPGIDFYELRDDSGNVVFRGNALTFTEPVSSTNMVRRIYAHNISNLYSSSYTQNSFSFDVPTAVAGYDFTLYKDFYLHTFTANATSERVAYYEVASDLAFTSIIWKGNTVAFTEKISSTASRTVTRYIRAVNSFGAVSATTTKTNTFSAPAAPTLSIDRSYPSSVEITITGSASSDIVKNTVVQISTQTGGSFDANIVETRVLDGKETAATISGAVSGNANLYVKAYYKDAFTGTLNDPVKSTELTCTFTQFATGDLADGIISAVKLATDAVTASKIQDGAINTAKFATGIEPVTIVTSVPTSFVTNTVFNTTDGKLYKWSGSAPTPYLTSVTHGTPSRNDFTGWVGMKFNTGTATPTIQALGRMRLTGNSGTHTIKLWKSDGTLIASANVDCSTGVVGDFIYTNITPVTLLASTTYHLMSQETSSGDSWWDNTGSSATADASVGGTPSSSYTYGDAPPSFNDGSSGQVYVPVNLKFGSGGGGYVAAAPTAFSELTGQVVQAQIADAAINTAKFAANIEPVTIVTSVPSSFVTQTVYNTTDSKLYKWNGSAYVAAAPVAFADLTGQITSTMIQDAAVSVAKFASGIEPVTVVSSVPGTLSTKTIFNTTDGKLYRWNGSAYVSTVPTVDLTGTIASAQVADGAISTAKFAASIEPVTIVTSVPGTLSTKTIFNTTDGKLYKWNGSAYVQAAATDLSELTGSITSTQITDGAISTPKLAAGAVTAAKIAAGAITANEIAADTITAGQIAAGAISTSELAAGSVTAVKIAAGTITANEIAALTILAANIAAGTITGDKIAANTITAANIAADTITAGEIQAGAIHTSELAAGAVTAAKIAAGTITANEIAALTITAGLIAAGTITGDKIAANTITAANIAADTITAGEISAGAINTSELAAGAVTAAKIAAGTITANEIAANTIVAGNIAAGTITGDKIAANTITASNIAADTITAGEIAAGAITASEIAAGAITVDKLAVGSFGPNMILNPSFEAGSACWAERHSSSPIGVVTQLSDAPNGDYVMRLASGRSVVGQAMSVVPGKKYVVRCRLRSTDGSGLHYFEMYERADKPSNGFCDENAGFSTYTAFREGVSNAGITSWTSEATLTYIYTVPAGKYWVSPVVIHTSGTGYLDVDDFEMNQLLGQAYIADASIGSAQIIDAAILTAKIADAQIIRAKIANLAVGTAQIDDAAITTAKIHALAVDTAQIADAAINMLKVNNLTSNDYSADTTGFRLLPGGTGEFNGGILIKSVPLTEIQVRTINSIDQSGRWRGNDTGRVPVSTIVNPTVAKNRIHDDNVADVVIAADITGYHIDDTANADSVARAQVEVLNKFGESVKVFPDMGYFGTGVVGVGDFNRKYADPSEEAIFKIKIWNRSGYSDPIYLNAGSRSTSIPTVKLRANCPLELSATPVDANSISLTWQFGSTVTVYKRQKGSSTWVSHATGVSSSSPYTVTGLSERTFYEFKVSAGSGNDSNIALMDTKQIGSSAPSYPAPSGLSGSPDGSSPTTQINLSWARNATNNDNVEVYKDGSLLTTLSASSTSYSATGLTAGTSYVFKVRNKWTTGPTYSEYSNEITVSTQASAPSASAPSGLSVVDNSVTTAYAARLTWTNNGGAGTISVDRKLEAGGTWATIASGLASSTTLYDDTGVSAGTYGRTYYYRVSNSAVTGYSNEASVFITPYDGGDPYCVTLDTLVLVIDLITGVRSWIPISNVEVGMVVVTVNTLTGKTNRAYVQDIRDGFADFLFEVHSTSGEIVRSSDSHPYVEMGSRDGRPVSQLTPGSNLLRVTEDSNFAEETFVDHIEVTELAEPVAVRTLVLGVLNHTFVTGSNGVSGLVSHNTKQY